MKPKKKAVKKLPKRDLSVSLENISELIDIALDARFPEKNPNRGNFPCAPSWAKYRTVPVERVIAFRCPTTWEKFVWGDSDYAPWKRKSIVYETQYC